jgi:hypothetical protein
MFFSLPRACLPARHFVPRHFGEEQRIVAMTATRRHIIRRIHRETGRSLREIVRSARGKTAADIARGYMAIETALAA